MKRFKGTKGEWVIDPYDETSVRIRYKEEKFGYSECQAEAIANARLIAAAPRLLEKLIAISYIIKDSEGVSGYHLDGAVAEWDSFEELFGIEELINKALGL